MKKSLLLMLFLALTWCWTAKAQTTVEIGKDAGTTTNNYLPAYTLYNNTLSEQIYTATEVGMAGTITSIAFYNGGSEKSPEIKVYLVNTNKSDFSSTTDWLTVAESDLVYDGTVTFVANDWTTIEFQNQFSYDGTSNLGLIIDEHMQYSSGLACRVFTSTSNCSMYAYSDGTNYNAVGASYTASGRLAVKNQIKLEIIPAGASICMKPKGLSATLTEGAGTIATLNWVAGESESEWVLQYGTDELFAANTYTEINVTGTPTQALTGLTAETKYYARVKAICDSNSESNWSSVISFKPSNYYSLTVNNRPSMTTTSSLPIYGSYIKNGVLSQFIIPADSLLDVAGGSIYSLSFYTNSTPDFKEAEFDVMVTEVAYTSFTNSTAKNNLISWDDMTKAYSGQVSVSEGKMTIVFDNPYTYNGGNLVIGFNETNMASATASVSWIANSGTTSTYVGLYGYKSSATASDFSYSRTAYGLKTTLAYLPSSTPRVESITQGAITASSATFSWIVPSTNVTGYAYQYKLASDENWPAAWSNTTATAVTLTGLNAGTSYEFRIKALYGSDESVSSSVSFITLFSIPTIEGFDTTICPLGWSRYSGLLEDVMAGTALTPTTSGWNFNTGNGVFDNHAKVNIYGTSCQYWLVTPTIVMEANVQLTFDLALTKYSGTLAAVDPTQQADDKFVVLASTDNGATWTILRQWDNAGSQYVYNEIACSATGQTVAINLNSYSSNNLLIAFYGESTITGNGDNNLHIDNVSIDHIPACAKPSGLSVSNIGKHTAELSWTENGSASAWKVAYKVDDESVTTFTEVGVTANSYMLTGLLADTTYIVKVCANCGGSLSEYTTEVSFTTAIPCAAPVLKADSVKNITAESVDIHWGSDPDAVGFTVSYRTAAYMEGFEENFDANSIPSGWTRYSGLVDNVIDDSESLTSVSGYWSINSYAFGAYNMKINVYGTGCKYWLVTPEITIDNGYTFSFDLALTDYNNSDPIENLTAQQDDRFVVLVYDGQKWTILREWNNASSATYVYNAIPATGQNINDIDISGYAGQTVKFAFYVESTEAGGDNDLHIDNVHVGIAHAAGAWQDVNAQESPITLSNLASETIYDVTIQCDCGMLDGTSDSSAVIQFKTAAGCQTPDGLAAADITASSASISWNTYGQAAFKLRYKADTVGAAWSNPEAVAQPHVLSGLAANTAYKVQVQPTCAEATVWSDSMSFRTECDAISTLPYSYDFEKADKFNCWTPIAGAAIANSSSNAHQGSYYLKFSGSVPNAIALPAFAAPINTLRLELWTRPESNTNSNCGQFSIGYMTDLSNASTFVAIETYQYDDWSSKTYEKKTVDFSSAPSNAYIVLSQHNNTSGWYWYVDDITVKEIPSCFSPTNLTAATTPGNGTVATLSWAKGGNESAWVLEYGTSADFTGAASVNISGTPSKDLTGLTAETTYYARVKADCGGGDASEWSDAVSFEPTAKVVIGSGTGTNTNLPSNTNYNYSFTQQIYTSAELGESGAIVSVDFYMTSTSDYTRSLDIYMVSTDKNEFASNLDWISVSASDLVFSGDVPFEGDSWTTITLDHPFNYDGVHNVAIIVDDNTGDWSSRYFKSFTASDNQAIYKYRDDTDIPVDFSESGTITTSKNQIRVLKGDFYALKINATGYGTFYDADNAYTMPDNLTGHTFSVANHLSDAIYGAESSLINVLPAGEPVVMKAADGISLPHTFQLVPATSSAAHAADNDLIGVNEATTIADEDGYKFFILSMNAAGEPESVGFYYATATGAGGFNMPAHKAYLKVLATDLPAGAPSAFFLIDEENNATWLENLEGVEGTLKFLHEGKIFILREGVIYDATGRQVRKL